MLNNKDIFHNIKDLKEIKVSTLLLNYLIETQKRDLEHLQMIEEINNQDFMTMDLYTKKSLELTENSKDHEKYGSLFWLLDMTKSAMGAMAVYTFINAWNMYMWPLLVTGSDKMRTVQIGIGMLDSVDSQSITLMIAGVVLIILPSISIFIAGQKQLIRGMFSGAVKG